MVSQAIRPLKSALIKPKANLDPLAGSVGSESSRDAYAADDETPMNEVLAKMISRMQLGKLYNPAAHYVAKRKIVVDWMCTVAEDMGYQPEAIHHSISVFDSYYSIPNIEEIQARTLGFLSNKEKKTEENLIQLVAAICLLISAKFLELTYPGVSKLNQITQSPYSYDEYILMEKHMLQTLSWNLHVVTPYEVL